MARNGFPSFRRTPSRTVRPGPVAAVLGPAERSTGKRSRGRMGERVFIGVNNEQREEPESGRRSLMAAGFRSSMIEEARVMPHWSEQSAILSAECMRDEQQRDSL